VNLVGENINSIKRNTEAFIGAGKGIGLEINVEKTKYMLLARHHNGGQNHYIKIANRSFENVAPVRYFGNDSKNQYLIQEEIKRRLNSDNACYHSV
jgi:hypothetical protein